MRGARPIGEELIQEISKLASDDFGIAISCDDMPGIRQNYLSDVFGTQSLDYALDIRDRTYSVEGAVDE